MSYFHELPAFKVENETELAKAAPWTRKPVKMNSPAVDVMTDLTQIKAATIQPSTTLFEAEKTMMQLGVRLLFVAAHPPQIEGLITTNDMHGEKPLKVGHAKSLRFDELTVEDVMTHLNQIDAIAYDRVRRAAVGDAISTMKRFGRNHLLVVEEKTDTTPRRIRGLISRSQIERQLGEKIEIERVANSFTEIEKSLLENTSG